MRVLSNIKSIHTLLDLVTNKITEYHVYDIKPFIFDPSWVNSIDASRHDYSKFFVEPMISMRGNPKRLTSLYFVIKWVGYDDTHNSEKPWRNLRDLAILHTYLRDKDLGHIILCKFKHLPIDKEYFEDVCHFLFFYILLYIFWCS